MKQQLRQDMKEAFDDLQMVKHENALTEEDYGVRWKPTTRSITISRFPILKL